MDTLTKTCSNCGMTKALVEFYRHATNKDRLTGKCRSCKNEQVNCYRRKNPERVAIIQKNARLRHTYGMSVKDYEAMLNVQGGGCAICGKTFEENGGTLPVDHDHSCCPGRRSCGHCVRAILCTRCNRAMGMFNDSIEMIESVLAYLRKWE